VLAAFNGRLYAAWKGVPGDNRMFWSSFDGTRWSPEQQGVGNGTSDGPNLAVLNARLFAAWKGVPNDTRMFWSSFVSGSGPAHESCAHCNDGSCQCGYGTPAELCANHNGNDPEIGCIQQQ
jgi:hypothetical protein